MRPEIDKAWAAVTDPKIRKSGKLAFISKQMTKRMEKESKQVLDKVEEYRIAASSWAPPGETKPQQNMRVNR